MIQIFLITIGLILIISGIYQSSKYNIRLIDYEMQLLFIFMGILLTGIGILGIIINLN